jgi:hypothetical protein
VDSQLQQLFVMEIKNQCIFAKIAYNDFRRSLESNDMDRIWYSIQGFLVAVANISKMLWSTKVKYPNRGEDLRKSLSVDNNSPLNSRKVRNHFEHFDDRLETWYEESPTHRYIDRSIASGINFVGGSAPIDYIRNFDNDRSVLTFRGEEYEIIPVINAVEELLQSTEKELNRLFFYR